MEATTSLTRGDKVTRYVARTLWALQGTTAAQMRAGIVPG
jgi:hypothetical protein